MGGGDWLKKQSRSLSRALAERYEGPALAKGSSVLYEIGKAPAFPVRSER